MVFANLQGMIGQLGFGGAGVKFVQVEGGLGPPPKFGRTAGRLDLEVADFYSAVVTNLKSAKWQELGVKTVAAQQAMRYGFGAASSGGLQNQGFIHMTLKDIASGTAREGKVRLVWKDANKFTTQPVKEFKSDNLKGSRTDRNQQVLLPELPIPGLPGRNYAIEDEFLGIDYKPDSNDITISNTNAVISISATQYFA